MKYSVQSVYLYNNKKFKLEMMKSFTAASVIAVAAFADDCSYYYNLGCSSGDVTTNPPDWADRSF